MMMEMNNEEKMLTLLTEMRDSSLKNVKIYEETVEKNKQMYLDYLTKTIKERNRFLIIVGIVFAILFVLTSVKFS